MKRRESLFWEATCQRLAGHVEKSRTLYEAFLAATPGGRNKALAQEARRMVGPKGGEFP